nr:EOG090X01QX [Eurycercus lamellatus]
MLASSKMLPLNVDVEASHTVVNSDSDMLSASSPKCHSLSNSIHLPKTRNTHQHYRSGSRKIPPKSPDLIELSDAGQSPVSGLEDDSSPGVTTDADSETYCDDTESPTPTNSAVNVDPKNYWQGAEEHRELLATEGEEEEDDEEEGPDEDDKREIELVEIDTSDSEVGTSNNPSSDSEAGNLSCSNEVEDIDEEELWKIRPDQLSYYKAQFKTLQTDPSGLVGGSQAKPFFEKSRLPTVELSHIWQLSDVTKDGALSLNEFCTAMHLVVLRRNKIALPKQLPPVLDPLQMITETAQPPTVPPPPVVEKEPNGAAKPLSASLGQAAAVVDSVAGTSQHWTKFVDSPTGSMASPGPQPVNFDFKRAQVEQDPRILHPVALRLTPESQQQTNTATELSTSSGAISLPPSASSTLGSGLITNSTAGAGSSVGKKEPPPPPPPRPYRGHARSSSLDLNQLGRGSGLNTVAPPAVPPRVSPSMGSPRKENEVGSQGSSGGAFQVYRRPAVPIGSATPDKKVAAQYLCSLGSFNIVEHVGTEKQHFFLIAAPGIVKLTLALIKLWYCDTFRKWSHQVQMEITHLGLIILSEENGYPRLERLKFCRSRFSAFLICRRISGSSVINFQFCAIWKLLLKQELLKKVFLE